MGMKSKSPLSSKINVHQQFFVLWQLFHELYSILRQYQITTHKDFVTCLEKKGRAKYKSRGRLFFVAVKDACNVSDLLFRRFPHNPRLVVMPLFLLMLLKEVVTELIEYHHLLPKIDNIYMQIRHLCEYHQEIVNIVFKKFARRKFNILNHAEDLKLEGYLALHHAVCNYDSTVNFNTYAYYWCFKYMMEYAKRYIFTYEVEYNDNITTSGGNEYE